MRLGPPDNGLMISDRRNHLRDSWSIATFPASTLTLLILAVNFVGVRDASDPWTRRR